METAIELAGCRVDPVQEPEEIVERAGKCTYTMTYDAANRVTTASSA